MPHRSKASRDDVIEKIVALIHRRLPKQQAQLIESFVHQYYVMIAGEDLAERDVADLYGAVVSHWNFLYKRAKSGNKVHVFNPNHEQHGWESKHTVVEIIHEDMPFLVDSVRMELNRYGVTVHMMIYPGRMHFERDAEGKVIKLLNTDQAENSQFEAPIYAEIDRQTDVKAIAEIQANLEAILDDVSTAVDDWPQMKEKACDIIKNLTDNPPPLPTEEVKETLDFVRWLANDNFTFLGYRDYKLVGDAGHEMLEMVPRSGLGLLRDIRAHHVTRCISDMSTEARKLALSKQMLIIAKTTSLSTVHRPAYTDYLGVKRFDAEGRVIGEQRFIGLYTSSAYNSNPKSIPFLRRKVEKVLARSQLPRESYLGNALLNILETYPRDELFQASEDELFDTAMGVFYLQERRRIKLFVREDSYGRFFSCLVYVPRDCFNSALRERMGFILQRAFNGEEVNFNTAFSESVLMRIHFIIRLAPNAPKPDYDLDDIEKQLIASGRHWQDDLRDALLEYYGEANCNRLYRKYANAFPAGYREGIDPKTAVHDIEHMEQLTCSDSMRMTFYRPLEASASQVHFKLYVMDNAMPLSDILPVLENMGLRVIGERSHDIVVDGSHAVLITDFTMFSERDEVLNIDRLRNLFQEAFAAIWFGRAENDGFNRLVLSASLAWREISILRAYAKYLRQIGFTFSQSYVEATLAKFPKIARLLVDLFTMRFMNNQEEKKALKQSEHLREIILKELEEVSSLDEDRILKSYVDVIFATLRSNYYQKNSDGKVKDYLSFKLDPALVPDMPLPKPMYEIFVYSPRVEGVHLRGGRVARGGLRWSDRREDFRTEVLGLMKAQQVKNAVIVPSGAKGGFVPKQLPDTTSRDEMMQEVVDCYKTFIRGLLDITDNLNGNTVIPAPDCMRYDDDDAYLVVAADKGTATFSDIANTIAEEYQFWLGDAFASGGSVGYDHKKMGITARGAWESVKRHFRELGRDIQTEEFTVVGIGDMSGDVFGNGMLLSPKTKLVGAFNHLHIFLDPDPDIEKSYSERERLFQLTRSSWADYNADLISRGGGVFKRSAKSIKLSPEIKQLLRVNKDYLVPNDLISAMLKAPVDLLWSGGIGTYVKGSQELHTDVGDRANDGVRVNGKDLRCKVVGEGGNLGLTQLGRVEYALNNGISYTDFIDNAGGVDCSDHEVNIKILLSSIVEQGDMTQKQRSKLLEKMTEAIGSLVLKNNYRQTQAISLASSRAVLTLDEYARFIHTLERSGYLNRELEFLPSDEELAERKANNLGLTRPELSVLLAYSKIALKEELLASDITEEAHFSQELAAEFPDVLQKRYMAAMKDHKLRREIIATQLSNTVTDDMGATFIKRLYDETGAEPAAVTRCFAVAREVFDMPSFWQEIDVLDNKIDAVTQFKMRTKVIQLVRRGTRWFLRNRRRALAISETVEYFSPCVKELTAAIPNLIVGTELKNLNTVAKSYIDAGAPEALAMRVAAAGPMISALDIIAAATENNLALNTVAQVYFTVGEKLELDWFREEIGKHPVANNWDALARAACRDDLDRQQRTITEGVFNYASVTKNVEPCITQWLDEHQRLIERWHFMISDLKATKSRAFSMFTVALRELLDLAQASKLLPKR